MAHTTHRRQGTDLSKNAHDTITYHTHRTQDTHDTPTVFAFQFHISISLSYHKFHTTLPQIPHTAYFTPFYKFHTLHISHPTHMKYIETYENKTLQYIEYPRGPNPSLAHFCFRRRDLISSILRKKIPRFFSEDTTLPCSPQVNGFVWVGARRRGRYLTHSHHSNDNVT